MRKTISYLFIICLFLYGNSEPSFSAEIQGFFLKTPVLFVHGRGMNSSSFKKMITYLENKGYSKEYLRAIDLWPNDGPNIQAAEKQIAPFIEGYLKDLNKRRLDRGILTPQVEKIDIVAHSMGSVSSRWYIAKIRPDRVRTWISIAGPNHGNNYQCPGNPGSGKRDLCPAYAKSLEESYVQFMLNGAPGPDIDETPFGIGEDSKGIKRIPPDKQREILYLTIRTDCDEWLDPKETVIIDGAGGIKIKFPQKIRVRETSPGNFLMMDKIEHDELLLSQQVFEMLNLILSRK